MTDDVDCSFTLDAQYRAQLQRYWLRRGGLVFSISWYGSYVAALSAVAAALVAGAYVAAVLAFVSSVAIYVVLALVTKMLPGNMLGGTLSCRFTAGGVEVVADGVRTHADWARYRRVVEDAACLYIEGADRGVVIMVPKQTLSERDLGRLRTLLATCIHTSG